MCSLFDDLEKRVQERTAQLEVANQELESFSYSVSHDLRAPLRAMSGFSRILMEDYQPQLAPEAARYLGLIAKNASQMGELINDLLQFSRLNRQPLERRKVLLEPIVSEILAELQAEQGERKVQVSLGRLPACQADPALLKQVWVNLLSNAFKFTRRVELACIEIGSMTLKALEAQGTGSIPEALKHTGLRRKPSSITSVIMAWASICSMSINSLEYSSVCIGPRTMKAPVLGWLSSSG